MIPDIHILFIVDLHDLVVKDVRAYEKYRFQIPKATTRLQNGKDLQNRPVQ